MITINLSHVNIRNAYICKITVFTKAEDIREKDDIVLWFFSTSLMSKVLPIRND